MTPATILELTVIAGTIPFVLCVLAAFNPESKVRDIGDYYLYDRQLDVDSFLKSTVGYSLQVAAIALFFLWAFSYGLWAVLVCISWGIGYFIVAELLRLGEFDAFLGTARTGRQGNDKAIATIHGYIESRLNTQSGTLKAITVLVVSLASVIGLGGTMLTEIYYGTSFFTAAIGIPSPNLLLETIIHFFILFFALLYILWGGFKSSVFIDRFQTPIAYVAFAFFALGVAMLSSAPSQRTASFILVFCLFGIFVGLLGGRARLLAATMPTAVWNKAVSYLTFFPLIVLSLTCLCFLGLPHPDVNFRDLLFPKVNSWYGFGIFGVISLAATNAIWQLIDISSLQRLQSLDVTEVKTHRANVVRAFRWIGFETALGWTIIVIAGLLLKAAGFTVQNDQVTSLISQLVHASNNFGMLLPIFIFTVVVFMVSTVSCFITALSYIARYDIAPALGLISAQSAPLRPQELATARLTTLIVIVLLYAGYSLLVAGLGHDSIATVLYAVYAFQVAITPAALVSLFLRQQNVEALAAIISTLFGMALAWVAALQPQPPSWLAFVGTESWYVIPPLLVILGSCSAYLIVCAILKAVRADTTTANS